MAPGKRRPEIPVWFVYVLRCRDGSLYTGATNDLARRLERHNAGRGAAYTRSRRPVALAWSEAAGTRGEALRREAAIKRLTRAEKLVLVGAAPARAKRPGEPGRSVKRSRAPRG